MKKDDYYILPMLLSSNQYLISFVCSSTPGSDSKIAKSCTANNSRDNSFTSPVSQCAITSPVTPKVVNSPVTMPGVASLAMQQQLMNIVNSPNSPREPYYVIMDKGLPTEQTYLVDPSQTQNIGQTMVKPAAMNGVLTNAVQSKLH